jgi:hypothetical protein
MAAVMQTARTTLSRYRWVAGALAIALIAAYAYFAAYPQPLTTGPDEALYRPPGQVIIPNTFPDYYPGPGVRAPLLLLSYVDGAEASLVKTLYNQGTTPITITGVETSPTYLTGALVTLKGAQPAAISGPPPCSLDAVEMGAAMLSTCQLNEGATWSGGSFRPIEVSPRKVGVIAVHLLMSHCEDNGPGGYEVIDSIQVHYIVLGFPHDQSIDVGPYWFQSPDTCPRPRQTNS